MEHIQEVKGFECTWKNITGCSENAFCCDNNPDLKIVWSLGPNVCRYRNDCGYKFQGRECVCNEIGKRFEFWVPKSRFSIILTIWLHIDLKNEHRWKAMLSTMEHVYRFLCVRQRILCTRKLWTCQKLITCSCIQFDHFYDVFLAVMTCMIFLMISLSWCDIFIMAVKSSIYRK